VEEAVIKWQFYQTAILSFGVCDKMHLQSHELKLHGRAGNVVAVPEIISPMSTVGS
jgi:hypothetical protein